MLQQQFSQAAANGPPGPYRSAPSSACPTPRKMQSSNLLMSPSASSSQLELRRSTSRNVSAEKDLSRSRAIGTHVDRQYVPVTAYQPVDTITKTVEVPLVRVVETIVPKPVVEEKIVHVEKRVPHYVEKVVEVPQYHYVEKVVEVPEVQYTTKYVPKIEWREKIVECPRYEEKWVERIVEVPQIREVVRFKEIVEEEEVYKYIPAGQSSIDWDAEYAKFLQNSELRPAGEVSDGYAVPRSDHVITSQLPTEPVETPATRTLLPSPVAPAFGGFTAVPGMPRGQPKLSPRPHYLESPQITVEEPPTILRPVNQYKVFQTPAVFGRDQRLKGGFQASPRKRQTQWCCP